jgi:hypothetical protein
MLAYLIDENNVYITSQEIDPMSKLPRCVFIEPPALSGTEVAQFQGGQWVVLPEYPQPVKPLPQVPSAVTMRQARLALLKVGKLALINQAIAGLPSPQKQAAEIEWEYSQEVQRHNGFVSLLAPLLGMSNDDLDALFIMARSL